MARSGNGIDIGAVYQLLVEMSGRMDGMSARLDSHDRKLDQLLDVVNEHSRKMDDLAAGLTELRLSVNQYHGAMAAGPLTLDFGRRLRALEARVGRIERHLNPQPNPLDWPKTELIDPLTSARSRLARRLSITVPCRAGWCGGRGR